MKSAAETAAKKIHDEVKILFKANANTDNAFKKYDELLIEMPDERYEILSLRAYSWAWINELGYAVDDLLETIRGVSGAKLASDLTHLSRLYLQQHNFRQAEPLLARLIEVEQQEASTYFLDYARLMRSYCLAKLNRPSDALAGLEGLTDEAEERWVENLPPISKQTVREMVAKLK